MFTVVTANIPGRAGRRRIRRWLKRRLNNPPRKGLPAPSICVFQEFMHGVDDFQAVMPKYWHIMSVFGPQPFAFDTREWKLIEIDGEMVYDDIRVGKKGAGPAVLSERHVQWVHLKHKKKPRAHVYIFNTHAPPSKQVPLQKDGVISRDELHEMLMQGFADKIDCTPNPVIFMGDINAQWGHQNVRPLRQSNLELANDPTKPTHGKSIIDVIAYRGGKVTPNKNRWQIKRVAAGVFPKLLKKDHKAAWATFEFVR